MKTILLAAMTIALLLPVGALAQEPTPKAKAEAALAQARAAIGDDARRSAVKSLSVTGTLRHADGEHKTESELRYDFLLPDRVRKRDSRDSFATVTTMVDDVVQIRQAPVTDVLGGHREEMEVEESKDPWIQSRVQALQRDDLTRLLLCWLLTMPSSVNAEYNHLGIIKGQNRSAEVVEVLGQNGFRTRLLIDPASHQLMGLAWRAKRLPDIVRLANASAGAAGKTPQAKSERRQKDFEEAEAKTPDVRFRWLLSDFRVVDGLNLPHRIVKLEDGVMKEEWSIQKFQLNPDLSPALFDVKKKK